jgi:FkbM family methyltransferase
MWFARQFPEARIYAIEPDPRNAELCRRNCRRYANVVVMEAAIGSVSGKVAISGANNQSWGVRTERGPDATVPAVTIADILREGPTPRELFMIKIDIEGFESDLFADNVDWIASPAVIMIELHDWMLPGQYSSASFQKAMAPYRFEMLNLHSNLLFIK